MRKHSLGEKKPVYEGPVAQILKFPENLSNIKWLMSQEIILEEDLRIQETYDERVGTRKELRKVKEKLSRVIQSCLLQSITWKDLRKGNA